MNQIIRAPTFNDAVDIITEGFVNYLPFERCGLFSYSSNDEIGFGLSGDAMIEMQYEKSQKILKIYRLLIMDYNFYACSAMA